MPARVQPEINLWEAGIYLIEKPDPVLGDLSSLGGVANLPLEQLANRTAWLKGRLANLSVSMAWVQVLVTVTGDWICPASVTQLFIPDAVAGGGGGAGTGVTSGFPAGGGGSEGCRVRGIFLTVVPGTTYHFTIGGGGAPGGNADGGFSPAMIGAVGGVTSIDDGVTTLMSLPGGLGGGSLAESTNWRGGRASTAAIGGFTFRGEHGWAGGFTVAGDRTILDGAGGGQGGAYHEWYMGASSEVGATDGGGGAGGFLSGGPLVYATPGAPGHIRFAYPLHTVTGNT